MVIIPTVLLCALLVNTFSKWINEWLPTREAPVCLRPVEIIYALPRIVAPFLIVYPLIVLKPMWCLLIWILLYLLSFWIKALFRAVCYSINILDNKHKRWN